MSQFISKATPKRRRAAMQAALHTARHNRVARINAATPSGPTWGATSYSALGGNGRRDYLMDITTNGAITNGPLSNLVNGVLASTNAGGLFFNTGGTNVFFKFALPFKARIDEFTWIQGAVGTQGTWKFSGSNDDITYTDLATGFDLGGAAASDVHAFTNTNAYTYYKLTQTGGTTSTARWMQEIQFKISLPSNDSAQAAAGVTAYANQDGQGNRVSRVLMLLNQVTACGGADPNNMSGMLDGTVGTASCVAACAWGNLTGLVIDLSFRQPLVIDEFTWLQQSAVTHGTWKLSASVDKTTYVDLLTGLTLGAGGTTDIHAFTNTKGYRNYRLTQTAGTSSSAPWLYEIQFKTSVLKA